VIREVLSFERLPPGQKGSRRAIVRWSDGRENVPVAVELRGGGPVSELSQAGEAATSGAAVVMGV